jgi:ABC-type polysaccharide/polyol phosphate transport system ATPase subunit
LNSHNRGEVAVSIKNLNVVYKTTLEKRPTLKNRLLQFSSGKKQTRIVNAVQDFNLEVSYGSVLGVVGANGAGKSTLMRSISGILPPTTGRIELYGSVSTLLALGVGFSQEMTGRDNVILGGLAAGLSRADINNKFDEIVDFAELREVIDAPMRTYSSGMYARLAFAVAVTVEPDILIIDEALSTGDAHFKMKSLNRVKELRCHNRALILVSHALATIEEVCNEVIWLNKGKLIQKGDPVSVVAAYKKFLEVGSSPMIDEDV